MRSETLTVCPVATSCVSYFSTIQQQITRLYHKLYELFIQRTSSSELLLLNMNADQRPIDQFIRFVLLDSLQVFILCHRNEIVSLEQSNWLASSYTRCEARLCVEDRVCSLPTLQHILIT